MDDTGVIRHELSRSVLTLRHLVRRIRRGIVPPKEDLAFDLEAVAAQIEGMVDAIRMIGNGDGFAPLGLANLPFTVLWLDDDIDNLEHEIFQLERAGIKTLTAKTIGEAEAQLDAVDGAILDIQLDKENGLDLLKTIRRQKPNLPVLVFSSYANDPALQRRAIEVGAIGVMLKGKDQRFAHNVLRFFENEIVAKRTAEALQSKAEQASQFLDSWNRERGAIADKTVVAKIDEQMGLLQVELAKKDRNPQAIALIVKSIKSVAENTAGSLIASGILARLGGVLGS